MSALRKPMPRRGSFERRLLVALVLISLIPSLLLIGIGTLLLSGTVALNNSPAAWERVAESGRVLLETASRSPDPSLRAAAERHRAELGASLVQSRRWEYVTARALRVIPMIAVVVAGVLVWLSLRSARAIAREMAAPIRELVRWAGRVGRGETLPAPVGGDPAETGEFGVLREAFRGMASELALSRERALEAERTRTWVAMARSVAHELRNPLTAIRLAAGALSRQTERVPAAREPLQVIEAESGRLEELARSFSQFGRLPEMPVSEINLSEELDYLLRTHLPPTVTGRLRAPVDLPHIHGHHDALSRAFSNLLLNAAEAMGEAGGTVMAKVSAVGNAVEVRVLDTGPGISPEHLERIWEPGFTTRSRGTGLGLALVRQTVLAHGGSIEARTRPGGGAEFRVLLPINDPPSSVVSPQSRTSETPASETGRSAADDGRRPADD